MSDYINTADEKPSYALFPDSSHTAERDGFPEVVAWLQSEFARRMEKVEQDFKYKVDQVQESLADAHKAHLRQVCPSLPFDTHTLLFAYSSLPTGCPCRASCALWHHCLLILLQCLVPTHLYPLVAPAVPPVPFDFHTLPFDTHALPSAHPSLPAGCPCCASCAWWHHRFCPRQAAIS